MEDGDEVSGEIQDDKTRVFVRKQLTGRGIWAPQNVMAKMVNPKQTNPNPESAQQGQFL